MSKKPSKKTVKSKTKAVADAPPDDELLKLVRCEYDSLSLAVEEQRLNELSLTCALDGLTKQYLAESAILQTVSEDANDIAADSVRRYKVLQDSMLDASRALEKEAIELGERVAVAQLELANAKKSVEAEIAVETTRLGQLKERKADMIRKMNEMMNSINGQIEGYSQSIIAARSMAEAPEARRERYRQRMEQYSATVEGMLVRPKISDGRGQEKTELNAVDGVKRLQRPETCTTQTVGIERSPVLSS